MNTDQPPSDRPPAKRDHLDELLDEADQESFPASDPPAVTPRREPVQPASAPPKEPPAPQSTPR